jgi:hypothetical protein
VTFDTGGTEVVFNPLGGGLTSTTVDSGHDVTGVACTAGPQCTIVDAAGGAVTFGPDSGGNDFADPRAAISTGTEPTSIACTAATLCVAVDTVSTRSR